MDLDVNKLPQETRQHLIDPNLLCMEKTLCDVLEHISEVETEIEEMKKQPNTLKSLLTDEEYITGGYISINVKLEELVRIADIQGGLSGSGYRQAQWFMAGNNRFLAERDKETGGRRSEEVGDLH
jgi:hypothetical protein